MSCPTKKNFDGSNLIVALNLAPTHVFPTLHFSKAFSYSHPSQNARLLRRTDLLDILILLLDFTLILKIKIVDMCLYGLRSILRAPISGRMWGFMQRGVLYRAD